MHPTSLGVQLSTSVFEERRISLLRAPPGLAGAGEWWTWVSSPGYQGWPGRYELYLSNISNSVDVGDGGGLLGVHDNLLILGVDIHSCLL